MAIGRFRVDEIGDFQKASVHGSLRLDSPWGSKGVDVIAALHQTDSESRALRA